jgi:hypothetical protein
MFPVRAVSAKQKTVENKIFKTLKPFYSGRK